MSLNKRLLLVGQVFCSRIKLIIVAGLNSENNLSNKTVGGLLMIK